MDFWGFEGRQTQELPGEAFMFLNGGASATPPAGIVTTGGPGGAPDGIEVSPDFVARGPRLETEFNGILDTIRSPGGVEPPGDYTYEWFSESAANRTTFQNWWRTTGRGAVDSRADPSALDGRITRLVGLQNRYSASADAMDSPPDGANFTQIRNDATGVMADIDREYGSPPGSPTARDGGGAPGDGSPRVGTASEEGPGYTESALGVAEGIGATTAVVNSAAGLVGSAGNVGMATRYTRAAWGGDPGGGIGFGYGDQFGGYSGGVGGGGAGVGIAGFGGVGDLTGTGFAIGAMGGDSRSKSRKLDAMINQLLAALAAGNLDVLETAITLCNQKARMTVSKAAMSTVRAMQLYDRQMQQLSDQMGSLAGQGNTQTMAPQLAQLNLQANQISSGRQMIANNLRDLMTMNEEIGNTEKGVRDTMSRIKTTQSRWG